MEINLVQTAQKLRDYLPAIEGELAKLKDDYDAAKSAIEILTKDLETAKQEILDTKAQLTSVSQELEASNLAKAEAEQKLLTEVENNKVVSDLLKSISFPS